MEEDKVAATLCSHYNSEVDLDKLWKALQEWNKQTAQCYRDDVEEPKSKNSDLLINLGSYKLACGKYTTGKCMTRYIEGRPEHCVALNPADAYVWYELL